MCEDESGGCVKIGFSKEPIKRWEALAHAGQILKPVKRIAVFKAESPRAARLIEKKFHASFAERRIQGEWFRFDFKNPDDKKEFNDTSRKHFRMGQWSSFPVSALERARA
jgi:hypothetical protein